MSRSSCPPGLERKLNREVHNFCPICGNFPLVRAHTIKKFSEVGWDYDYLLSICFECEVRVEKGLIDRQFLHQLKQLLKKSISLKRRTKPFQIPIRIANTVYLGSNLITSANVVISYRGIPLIWFENNKEGNRTLNARFYDFKGTSVSGIDMNSWTADRERFYDAIVNKDKDELEVTMIGKKDETKINLRFKQNSVQISNSIFLFLGLALKSMKMVR